MSFSAHYIFRFLHPFIHNEYDLFDFTSKYIVKNVDPHFIKIAEIISINQD